MALGRKTGGRQKGTPNKLTADLKAAILSAFGEVGGTAYLVDVARNNQAVFCQLLGKVLPTQLTGDPANPIAIKTIERIVRDPNSSD